MEGIRQGRWLLSLAIIALVVITSAVITLNNSSGSYGSEQIHKGAVSDGSGGTVIVWHDGSNFYCQLVDSAGQVQWQEGGVLIAACPIYDGFGLQSDGTGGAIIVWNDNEVLPGDTDNPARFDPVPFRAQRISHNGELLWSDTLVSAGGDWRISPDETGGTFIAWDAFQTYYKGLHDDYLYVQKLSPDGTRLWGDESVLLVSSSPYRPLTDEEKAAGKKGTYSRERPTYAGTQDMVSDGEGGAIIVWEEEDPYSLYAQRLDSNGNPTWADKVLVDAAGFQYDSLRSDGLGGAYLTIECAGLNFRQHIGGNGKLLEKTEITGTSIDDGFDGSINIRIVEDPPTGPIQNRSTILYIQRFDAAGNPLWPEQQVIATAKRYQLGNLDYIADGMGGIILIWQFEKENVAYGGLCAQRVDGDGNIQWGENGIAVFNAPDRFQGDGIILSDGSSGALIIATAGEGALGGDMVYAQHLDADGNRLWGEGLRIDR